jgi:hypothetical protein
MEQLGMPSWMKQRGATSSQVAAKSKAAKVVEDATAGARNQAQSQGRNYTKKDVLEQLVVILSKLTLSNTQELREITGMLYTTVLLPQDHTLAVASMKAGQEYQNMVKANKEASNASEAKEPKEKDKSAGSETAMDESEENSKQEEMGSPHIWIGMQALWAQLSANRKGLDKNALQALETLQQTWASHIQDKTEKEVWDYIKVWRCKKPQKPSKKAMKGEGYCKLIFCLGDDMADPLRDLLKATGGEIKWGKAPRSYLEREAQRLLGKVNKQ